MKGEWVYYKNKYSPEICNDIIRIAKSRPGSDAQLGVDGKAANNQHRKSKTRFVYPNDAELGFIFNDLWGMALESNDQWFGFHLSKLSYLQIAEYDGAVKGEYKKHNDVFWMNNDPKYHRKLSAIIQLSDPATYEGGNFELYGVQEQPNAAEIRGQGTVIFFPSFIEHAALPVTSGMRYSIAAWIDGPKWR
jgi:PKHD-type hydroxylase